MVQVPVVSRIICPLRTMQIGVVNEVNATGKPDDAAAWSVMGEVPSV
jgi:hypothetical protein